MIAGDDKMMAGVEVNGNIMRNSKSPVFVVFVR
jgi:hypothetical protein